MSSDEITSIYLLNSSEIILWDTLNPAMYFFMSLEFYFYHSGIVVGYVWLGAVIWLVYWVSDNIFEYFKAQYGLVLANGPYFDLDYNA